MNYLKEFTEEFWYLSLEMAPWLMLGLLFAGMLHVFLPKTWVFNQLGGKGFWPIMKGVLFGVPLPLCSCGVIPTAIQLDRQGASKPTTNAFLISTPQTGVDSMLATFALLGWPFAIIRPILAVFSGLLGGIIMDKSFKEEGNDGAIAIDQSAPAYDGLLSKWLEVFRYGFIEMVRDIGKWLLLGLALAAVIGIILPDQFFIEQVPNFFLQMLVVIAISVPLYVCATGSIPIALVLLSKGLAPALILLFLMLGPATNVASVVLISKGIGKRFFNTYLMSIVLASFIVALVVHFFVPDQWLISAVPNINMDVSTHQHYATPFRVGITSLLFALIFITFFPKKSKSKQISSNYDHSLEVNGMTCNNCKNLIESNLNQLDGVDDAEVDLQNNSIHYSGSASVSTVKSLVKKLGYSPVE